MSVQVSVVVPTYNRPDLLQGCLDALLDQDLPASQYEIVVADNAGSDETRALVEAISANRPGARSMPQVYYVEAADRRGPAAARNAGWQFAHGDIIAFTDDDCLPEPGWLREGLKALREGFDAVTGRVIVPVVGLPSDYEKNVQRLETAEFLTANCFIRCRVLQLIGGFDERFATAWREDSDLHFDMLELLLNVGKASRARVLHPVRPAGWGISLREQRKSMYNALLFKKHPRLYRQRIQGGPPLTYYAIMASVLGLVVSALLGHPYVAGAMALAWAGFTGEFVLRRLRGTRHDLRHVGEMLLTSALIPPLSVFWRLYGAVKYRVLFW